MHFQFTLLSAYSVDDAIVSAEAEIFFRWGVHRGQLSGEEAW